MKSSDRHTFVNNIKEIQVGYLISSYFMDIYLYLAQNKLPISKVAI